MQRMNRAGRESAIFSAIKRLETKGRDTMFTRGEICKMMGVKSSSHIRNILNHLVERGLLVKAELPLGGYVSEVQMYGAVYMKQVPLPERYINVCGQSMRADWDEERGQMACECSSCGKPMSFRPNGMCSTCSVVYNS